MTKSKAPKKSQGNFEILVPRRGAPTTGADIIEDAVKTHAIRSWTAEELFDVKKVDPKDMGADWQEKLDRIVDVATNAAAKKDKAWHIDEIEIGLTLSAKGELLFIAEAGVEATVKVVLKRT